MFTYKVRRKASPAGSINEWTGGRGWVGGCFGAIDLSRKYGAALSLSKGWTVEEWNTMQEGQ